MQPITKHSLFSLGQVVATPGALTALQKAGQQPQEFLARHLQGDWATCAKKTAKKTHSASTEASGFSAATTRQRAKPFTSSPKPTAVSPRFFCPKSIEIFKKSEKKEKRNEHE